jgi:hypothetical protein
MAKRLILLLFVVTALNLGAAVLLLFNIDSMVNESADRYHLRQMRMQYQFESSPRKNTSHLLQIRLL